MSLLPALTDAELLEMHAQRTGQQPSPIIRNPIVRHAAGVTVLRPLTRAEASTVDTRAIVWPVRITLPWSTLISDNAKYAPTLRAGKPVIILREDYRRCKANVLKIARQAIGFGVEPANFPLALVATVWVPDNMRAHDVPNFAKCAHDAMEGVVYTKDRWLYSAHWLRAGTDVDAPRAEIEIRPLATPDL